jgi:hypothetical protein
MKIRYFDSLIEFILISAILIIGFPHFEVFILCFFLIIFSMLSVNIISFDEIDNNLEIKKIFYHKVIKINEIKKVNITGRGPGGFLNYPFNLIIIFKDGTKKKVYISKFKQVVRIIEFLKKKNVSIINENYKFNDIL